MGFRDAVASAGPAGPYANNLHLAPDWLPHQHLITQFLQAGCSSWRPTNSVKALKAPGNNSKRKMFFITLATSSDSVMHWSVVCLSVSQSVPLGIYSVTHQGHHRCSQCIDTLVSVTHDPNMDIAWWLAINYFTSVAILTKRANAQFLNSSQYKTIQCIPV